MGLGRKRRYSESQWAYMSCDRKKKFKSTEASKYASKFNQRKYECHLCGHWHLTKSRGIDETESA